MDNLEHEIKGGSDSASPRYIHTQLNPIVDSLFPSADFPLLDYINDDGLMVEPKWYCPIFAYGIDQWNGWYWNWI